MSGAEFFLCKHYAEEVTEYVELEFTDYIPTQRVHTYCDLGRKHCFGKDCDRFELDPEALK